MQIYSPSHGIHIKIQIRWKKNRLRLVYIRTATQRRLDDGLSNEKQSKEMNNRRHVHCSIVCMQIISTNRNRGGSSTRTNARTKACNAMYNGYCQSKRPGESLAPIGQPSIDLERVEVRGFENSLRTVGISARVVGGLGKSQNENLEARTGIDDRGRSEKDSHTHYWHRKHGRSDLFSHKSLSVDHKVHYHEGTYRC